MVNQKCIWVNFNYKNIKNKNIKIKKFMFQSLKEVTATMAI